MKSVGIIGSNLLGLLCADILCQTNKVTIIDSELELGFPANFPGTSIDQDLFDEILRGQDDNNLFKLVSNNHINFRTEWFCKLITHKIAKHGTIIYNRTRIIESVSTENKIILYTSGSDINPQQLYFDIVIDISENSMVSLGKLKHEISLDCDKSIKPNLPLKKFFVGICLIRDLTELDNYHIALERTDELAEVWYSDNNEQFPRSGWIESRNVNSYYNERLMILDDYYEKAVEICDMVNNL